MMRKTRMMRRDNASNSWYEWNNENDEIDALRMLVTANEWALCVI